MLSLGVWLDVKSGLLGFDFPKGNLCVKLCRIEPVDLLFGCMVRHYLFFVFKSEIRYSQISYIKIAFTLSNTRQIRNKLY